MNLFWDTCFLSVTAILSILTYLRTRQAVTTVGVFFLAFLVAGSVLQSAEYFFGEFEIFWLNVAFTLCFLIFLCFAPKGSREPKAKSYTWLSLFFISTATSVAVVASRVFAVDQTSNVFAQLSYLSRGEDNAAWLVPSSKMAANLTVNTSSVSGPLALLLSISQSVVRVTFELTGIKSTQIGTTINTVVVAYFLVFISGAFALIPITRVFSTKKFAPSILVVVLIWMLFAGGLAQAASSGHLSLVLVCVFYVFGIGTSFGSENTDHYNSTIGGLVLLVASIIWLPLTFTIFLTAPYSAVIVLRAIKSNISKFLTSSICFLFIVSLLSVVIINVKSMGYSTESSYRIKSLITADGWTSSANSFILLFIALVFIGIVLGRNVIEENFSFTRIFHFTISIFLYISGIYILNIVIGGTINYGATKLLFGISIVLLPIFMSICLHYVFIKTGFDSRTIISLAASVLLFGITQGPINNLLVYASPTQWRTSNNLGGWIDEVQRLETVTKLEELPIGCVSEDATADISVNSGTYECTRFMLSLTGNWESGNYLNDFQLFFGKDSINNLKLLDKALKAKYLWTLDPVDGKIMGKQTVNFKQPN
jgi:hypothetical protein